MKGESVLRFLAGVAAAMLLMTGGLFWWKGAVQAVDPIPAAPVAGMAPAEGAPVTDPPRASAKTREEKRFARYDKDKDGGVARGEYLASRQKAFAKLDVNRDGGLSFDEYSVKTIVKFASADGDRSGVLTPAEFLKTRVVRKERPRVNCPPVVAVTATEDAD